MTLKTGSFFFKTVTLASGDAVNAWINLPAIGIVAIITAVLVVGVRAAAGFNAAMVMLNLGIILTIIGVGAVYVDPNNWAPVPARRERVDGRGRGAARIFFAYIGSRLDLDARRGSTQSTARPGHRHHQFALDLQHALHRGGGDPDRDDLVPFDRCGRAPRRGVSPEGADLRHRSDHHGDPRRP